MLKIGCFGDYHTLRLILFIALFIIVRVEILTYFGIFLLFGLCLCSCDFWNSHVYSRHNAQIFTRLTEINAFIYLLM
jgi:hypothetical protein